MPRIVMLREWEFKFNSNYLARYREGREYLVITRCAEAALKDGAARLKEDAGSGQFKTPA